MAIVTLLLALYVGIVKLSHADAGALTAGTRTAFIVFTVICFGGVFASLARGNAHGMPDKG